MRDHLSKPEPITDPVIILRTGASFIVVDRKAADGPRPLGLFVPAILWMGDRHAWSDVRPLGVWGKFLYYLEEYSSTIEEEGLPPLPENQVIQYSMFGDHDR